jgi:large subunit ribosomal protein L15
MKLKKRKKAGRMHGHAMGTHGWGARKKHISSGNRGGFGMSGTGKMAGHKKTYITKLYGTEYFGKQGITSRGTAKNKENVINIWDLVKNLESLKKKFMNKSGVIDMGDYKILGDGEIKEKITIKAKAASQSAIEKIEKAGGKIIIPEREEEKPGEKIEDKKPEEKAKGKKEVKQEA